MTDIQFYFLTSVLFLAGIPVTLFSLKRGTEPARKRLRLSLLLLGGMILLRFGGEYVLSLLDMGWRCTPRYTMSFLIWVLLLVSIYQSMRAFDQPQEKPTKHHLAWLGSFLSLLAATGLVTLLMIGLSLDTLHESTPSVNGQTVVRESKMNGGAVRRFYLPVNALVHGQELEYDWRTNLVTLPTGEKGNPV